jgi:hypothetical protein
MLHLFQCQSKRFQNIGHWEMPQSEDVWLQKIAGAFGRISYIHRQQRRSAALKLLM